MVAVNNLANHYTARGQPERALPLLTDVLGMQQEHLYEGHPHTLASQFNLAAAYRDLGQFEQAEVNLITVLEGARHKLGASNPTTIRYTVALCNLYLDHTKEPAKAIPLIEQVVAVTPIDDPAYANRKSLLDRLLSEQDQP